MCGNIAAHYTRAEQSSDLNIIRPQDADSPEDKRVPHYLPTVPHP